MKFTAIVSLAMVITTSYASPYINTDKIDAAIQAVQCASDVVHTVSEKVEIGNVWMSLYFPIVMHTNEFYGCQYWETQELSDKCVEKEMTAARSTINKFLGTISSNNTEAAADVRAAIVYECEIPLDDAKKYEISVFALSTKKVSLKKLLLNIDHIKCVGGAIAIAIGNSELASTWIDYHIQLKDSISKIVMCSQHQNVNKTVCILVELHNTAKIMLNYWKYLSDKKHLEVLNEIKAEIKSQCY